MSTIFERVQKIVVEQLGVEENEVKALTSFVDDLHADSIDLIGVIMAIEENFTMNGQTLGIPDEDAENIKTVQDAVDYIKALGLVDE